MAVRLVRAFHLRRSSRYDESFGRISGGGDGRNGVRRVAILASESVGIGVSVSQTGIRYVPRGTSWVCLGTQATEVWIGRGVHAAACATNRSKRVRELWLMS